MAAMLPVRDHLPTRIPPLVNYALIAANVGAFLWELSAAGSGHDPEALFRRWALIPAELLSDPARHAPTLLTHMFLHGGFTHIGGNMLFLWIFGDNVEDALGHARYLFFYLLCGFAAAFAQIAASPHSTTTMVGASGAISGVLAAYMLLYPRSPISVLNPIPLLWIFWGLFIWLPAWFVIIEWFAVNLWSALHPQNDDGGVAFMAHVGGFIAGLVLSPLLRERPAVDHATWDRFATSRRRA
jgi:membrane associated rhomboid family serine protease